MYEGIGIAAPKHLLLVVICNFSALCLYVLLILRILCLYLLSGLGIEWKRMQNHDLSHVSGTQLCYSVTLIWAPRYIDPNKF